MCYFLQNARFIRKNVRFLNDSFKNDRFEKPCFRCKHARITDLLTVGDPLRFSKAPPKEVMKTVNRLWDPDTGVSPKPNRTIQDIKRLGENFLHIVEGGGDIVDFGSEWA